MQVFAPQQLWRQQVLAFAANLGVDPTAAPYNADPTGTNDSSAAFQAAITAAEAVNGSVIVPPGTFKLASTLNITGTMNFLAAGLGTIFKPATDGIGTMFNVTGTYTLMSGFKVDGSAIVSPTYTCIEANSGGGQRFSEIFIFGAGTGVYMPQGNACRFTNMRIQLCTTCVLLGGIAGVFAGDTTWTEIVAIPTTTGTAWIVDGNTNAQYMTRVQMIGGACNLNLRGSGASTAIPANIYQTACDYSASSAAVVQIEKAQNVLFNSSQIGGSTADAGVLINASASTDIDGISFVGTQIGGNTTNGINWVKGCNLSVNGGSMVYANGGAAPVYPNINVGAAATGLCMITGSMIGLSDSGEIWGNKSEFNTYGIQLASGSLTDITNFPGRVYITGNMLGGNHTGAINDLGSAPTGGRNIQTPNMTA